MDLCALKTHMENFYLCSHLPIRAFDTNGTELLCTGYTPNTHSTNLAILEHLPILIERLQTQASITHEVTDHLHYTICPIEPNQPLTGFYIIGPFTNHLQRKDEYLFKPLHCMPPLISLLYTLSAQSVQPTMPEDFNYHVTKAEQYIKTHYNEPITLEALAQHLNLNKSYLCTIFKKVTKESFCSYTNKIRVEESKKLLKTTNDSMLEIALTVGFSSASYFNTIFKKIENQTPLEYRKHFYN